MVRLLATFTSLCLVALVTGQGTDDSSVLEVFFYLDEQLPNGSFIGNVAAESNLPAADRTFSFLEENSATALVDIDPATGDLRTAVVIDREKECKFEKECIIEFDVAMLTNGDFDVIGVNINIRDINDNTPEFDPKEVTFDVLESKPVDSKLPIRPAEDLDQGANNSLVTYSLSPASDKFALKVEKETPGEPLRLNIMIVKQLDHEDANQYRFWVLARDAGTPVRTGTLTVTINVLDENDNRPEFVESFLNISVTEDIGVGNVIVTLHAKDIDSGANGDVFYQLAPRQTDDIYNQFAIDNTTGQLTVTRSLVYNPDDYQKQIFVIASDRGDSPQSSQAEVFLTIQDAGNNRPVVTLNLLDPVSEGVVAVPENAKNGDFVAHINVHDTDTGTNGEVQCHTYNTYFGLEDVPGRHGYKQVVVQHELNRETRDRHQVTVTCVDGGDLETSVNFTVLVTDENDNPPRFTEYDYNTAMKENNVEGQIVINVTATDLDIGENARISYFLDPRDNMFDELDVEESTGIVRAKVPFDRERNAQKIFRVLAVDHGKEPKTSTTTVVVDLIDVNDNHPNFTRSSYELEVRENQPSGTSLNLQVRAVDDDQGDNRKLEYYLPPEYEFNGQNGVPFEVMSNGEILTKAELDREHQSLYRFEVGAHDMGSPPLSTTVSVIVKVVDVNDNAPQFSFPTQGNRSVSVLNEVSKVPFTQVAATDRDSGINQDLMFFILSGNDDNIFSMDANSGKLYVLKYIHLTEDVTKVLSLRVEDKGKPTLNATEQLFVTLRYTNATSAPATDGSQNSYVIIVVTVVIITVLLSITIIVVICLIRRNDIHKCGGVGIKFPVGRSKKKPSAERVQQLANDKVYPEDARKGKKEVSFSLEEGDSFSSNDFKLALNADKKDTVATRPTTLNVKEDGLDLSAKQPIGILRPSQPIILQKQLLEHTDVPMTVNHQREDSHSETSAETNHSTGSSDSRDSGNGGSEEESHIRDVPKLSPFNSSTYMFPNHGAKVHSAPAQPGRASAPQKPVVNTMDMQRPSVHYKDFGVPQSRVRNWSSDYPDSDYMSSYNSNHSNFNPSHIGYSDPKVWLNSNNLSVNPRGYENHGYLSSPRALYHPQNSLREDDDDDKSTTTSGSYTINENEFLDDSQPSIHLDGFRYPQSRHNVVV